MAVPSVDLDRKITELPEVLSAAPGDWLVIVVTNANGVAETSKIKKSNLVS